MRITELSISASDLAGQRRFYGQTLGLPVVDTATGFEVRIGWSSLRFEPGRPADHVEHIALLYSKARWDAAEAWLKARTPLLEDATGETRFSGSWGGGQLYFKDPDGNILELIGYDRWPATHTGDFGPQDLLGVAEFGLTVDDVEGQAQQLRERLGSPDVSPADPDFMWLGGPEGRLIVSRRGRIWFPDTGVPSTPGPFQLTVARHNQPTHLTHQDLNTPASEDSAWFTLP